MKSTRQYQQDGGLTYYKARKRYLEEGGVKKKRADKEMRISEMLLAKISSTDIRQQLQVGSAVISKVRSELQSKKTTDVRN